MSKDAQVKVEAHIMFDTLPSRGQLRFFLTPIDKLDKLKAQLNIYFVNLCKNQRTSHVFV